jgi:hypothetical protein
VPRRATPHGLCIDTALGRVSARFESRGTCPEVARYSRWVPGSGVSKQQAKSLKGPTFTLKRAIVDRALCEVQGRSIVDLGGAWAVDGHYTFHALDHHDLDRAVLVDAWPTDRLLEAASRYPRMSVMRDMLGDPEVPSRVGAVDVTLLFDILLHQVDPDWDQILAMYAPHTHAFGIVNPQWHGDGPAVRLLDLGLDRYRKVVPQTANLEPTLAKIDDLHPGYGRPHRDIFEIWQWGITDTALDRTLRELGFSQTYRASTGPWHGLAAFDNVGFVYVRD